MGDPKFSRKKYDTPTHPWQADRIQEENSLIKKYGLKNKREIWKAESLLRKFRQQARLLYPKLRGGDKQAQKETNELINRLIRLGVLQENANLDDVLALNVESILSRRLQTVIYKKGLASTLNQARQLIIHGHTAVGERKVTVPSYLVRKSEESFITYCVTSPLASELHPTRPKEELRQEEKEAVV